MVFYIIFLAFNILIYKQLIWEVFIRRAAIADVA